MFNGIVVKDNAYNQNRIRQLTSIKHQNKLIETEHIVATEVQATNIIAADVTIDNLTVTSLTTEGKNLVETGTDSSVASTLTGLNFVTPINGYYTMTDNLVQVYRSFSVQNSATNTVASFRLSLPVTKSTNFSNAGELIGFGSSKTSNFRHFHVEGIPGSTNILVYFTLDSGTVTANANVHYIYNID